MTSSWAQDSNTHGPVPTGASENCAPFCSISSRGTMCAAGIAMSRRNGANGCSSVISTVVGFRTLSPDSESASPAIMASEPAMKLKTQVRGLWLSGLSARSNEYLTSAAVNALPLWNVTSSRRWNV